MTVTPRVPQFERIAVTNFIVGLLLAMAAPILSANAEQTRIRVFGFDGCYACDKLKSELNISGYGTHKIDDYDVEFVNTLSPEGNSLWKKAANDPRRDTVPAIQINDGKVSPVDADSLKEEVKKAKEAEEEKEDDGTPKPDSPNHSDEQEDKDKTPTATPTGGGGTPKPGSPAPAPNPAPNPNPGPPAPGGGGAGGGLGQMLQGLLRGNGGNTNPASQQQLVDTADEAVMALVFGTHTAAAVETATAEYIATIEAGNEVDSSETASVVSQAEPTGVFVDVVTEDLDG